jgi:cytochrome P450
MLTSPITVGALEDALDPYPLYRRLRDEWPVLHDAERDSYLVSRFDDVYAVLADHRRFSSVPAEVARDPSLRIAPIIQRDPPEHTAMRRLVTPVFTPRAMKQLQPHLDGVVRELIDAAEEREVVECSSAFAVPLPGRVTLDILGLPVESHSAFHALTEERVMIMHAPHRALRTIEEIRADLWNLIEPVVRARQKSPALDVVTVLVGAQADQGLEQLPDQLIVDMLMQVLVGGFETTQHLIELLLSYLADHPETWARLREDRTLIDQAADEMVRWESPVQWMHRRATADAEIAGTTIPAGADVIVMYGSANRDERQFPEPDEFQLERNLKRHLAFSYGIHYCVGAPLTRFEVRTLLNQLLDRYVRLERAGPSQPWLKLGNFRGLAHVPVRLVRSA